MNTINVFIYSYKVKSLIENITDIVSKQSNKNKIIYHVFDQSTTDKTVSFKKINNVFYRYISWDDTKGIPYYRKHVLFDQSAKYFLELSPNISLSKNWDSILIESLMPNTIISGNSIKKIEIYKTHINVDEEKIDNISESNFIDMDLLFLKQIDSIFLNQLSILKHSGQNLFASILSVARGIKIFSMNSDFYTISSKDADMLYYPYSKMHGYNKMINIINSFKNDIFESFHGIKVSQIPKMYYQVDDVLYHDARTSIDASASTKFHNGYNSIRVL
jgi:hypothetical protein